MVLNNKFISVPNGLGVCKMQNMYSHVSGTVAVQRNLLETFVIGAIRNHPRGKLSTTLDDEYPKRGGKKRVPQLIIAAVSTSRVKTRRNN